MEGYRFLEVPTGNAHEYVIDKERSCREFATYFLLRVMKMFHYDNLPEEVPVDCLEKMLMSSGFVWFTKFKSTNLLGEERDQFYAFHGRMGSVIDAYYRPTEIIIANPGANCYKNFMLNKQKGGTYYGDDGVIIRNDTLYHGLMPLILRYAYLLAENILTMHTADVFLRIISLISAQDDRTLLSANEFIKAISDGKMMAVSESKFFEGVKMQTPPSNNGSYLTQFIEYQQYFLGSFFNEIGLNANFNMKRESIAKSESSLNEDSMLPLCQNMLMCRQQDFDVVNEMYGLNIKVSFDSAWLQNALEIMFSLNALKGESGVSVPASELGSKEGEDDKATEEIEGAAEEDAVDAELPDESSGGDGEGESEEGSEGGEESEDGEVGENGEDGECEESIEEMITRAAAIDVDQEELETKQMANPLAEEGGEESDRKEETSSDNSGDISEEE